MHMVMDKATWGVRRHGGWPDSPSTVDGRSRNAMARTECGPPPARLLRIASIVSAPIRVGGRLVGILAEGSGKHAVLSLARRRAHRKPVGEASSSLGLGLASRLDAPSTVRLRRAIMAGDGAGGPAGGNAWVGTKGGCGRNGLAMGLPGRPLVKEDGADCPCPADGSS